MSTFYTEVRRLVAAGRKVADELKLILLDGPAERKVIEARLSDKGFYLYETGGGIDVYRKDFGYVGDAYMLLTRLDDPDPPDALLDEVQVSAYMDDKLVKISFEGTLGAFLFGGPAALEGELRQSELMRKKLNEVCFEYAARITNLEEELAQGEKEARRLNNNIVIMEAVFIGMYAGAKSLNEHLQILYLRKGAGMSYRNHLIEAMRRASGILKATEHYKDGKS